MNVRPLIFALAIAVSIAAGAWGMALVGTPEPAATTATATSPAAAAFQEAKESGDPEQLQAVVESLVTLLDQEISERHILAEEIRLLRADVERLQGAQAMGDAPASISGERVSSRIQTRRDQQRQDRRERLLAAGFTQRDLEAVERRSAEATIRQMELDDRARREGWVNTPQYFEEARRLQSGPAAARGYLGDEAYDRYLFASGLPNRIFVNNVIATSAAEQAGLQQGDIVLSYGGEPVFTTDELVRLRSSGDAGSTVTMRIMRDGQSMEVTLPRGPIGIGTGAMVVDPLEIPDSG